MRVLDDDATMSAACIVQNLSDAPDLAVIAGERGHKRGGQR